MSGGLEWVRGGPEYAGGGSEYAGGGGVTAKLAATTLGPCPLSAARTGGGGRLDGSEWALLIELSAPFHQHKQKATSIAIAPAPPIELPMMSPSEVFEPDPVEVLDSSSGKSSRDEGKTAGWNPRERDGEGVRDGIARIVG